MTKKNFWSRWWLEVTSPLRAREPFEPFSGVVEHDNDTLLDAELKGLS